jgi:polyisoprenoid-binding protein YceI
MLMPTLTKSVYRSVLALVLCTGAATQALSRGRDEIVFDLDPAQTEIKFTLSGALHTVHGTFHLKSGTIRFEPATGKAAGAVIVDVTSGESGSGARDRKMHKDVLESQSYQEAVFTPDRVAGHLAPEGKAEIQVHGLFKLHGTEHEMTFQTLVETRGDQATAALQAIVPYTQWAMKNPSTFLLRVSDKVSLDIRTTGRMHPGTP